MVQSQTVEIDALRAENADLAARVAVLERLVAAEQAQAGIPLGD